MLRSSMIFTVLALLAALLSGCLSAGVDRETLLPPKVGSYMRTSGPVVEAETGVDVATYQGPEGAVTLRVKEVGAEQVATALTGLPPLATDVSPDPGLGQRQGVFFTFADEFHAAWGNGDWVFVLSASTDAARRAFLGVYGY